MFAGKLHRKATAIDKVNSVFTAMLLLVMTLKKILCFYFLSLLLLSLTEFSAETLLLKGIQKL